jgi:hypothetical protein
MKSNPNAVTEGLAPKVGWVTIALLVVALVTAVLDKVVLGDDVPDEIWLTLLSAAPGALAVGAMAPAALQKAKR